MPELPKGFHNVRLLEIVQRTIAVHDMFSEGEVVLVGVSGGPDSMALLHALVRLAPQFSLRLAVAHFDHGLRNPDGQHDATFVRRNAKRLKLPFHLHREDVAAFQRTSGRSSEEACRLRRYAFYERLRAREGFDKIALGHQADDNAELVLMNLLRGSGPHGLAGIPPVRDSIYVRPLIGVTREEIMRFVDQQGIAYVVDASNTDIRFTRNKVRHVLIPLLEKDYNPQLKDALNRTADILQLEDHWLRDITTAHFHKVICDRQPGQLTYAIPELNRLHPALQRRLLRHGIAVLKGDLRRISHKHLALVSELLRPGGPALRLDLPDRIRVQRAGANLMLARDPAAQNSRQRHKTASAPQDLCYVLKAPGAHSRMIDIDPLALRLKYRIISASALPAGCNAGQATAFFDMDRLAFPLSLRNILPGDRFQPLGLNGSQKVTKFLTNRKVPRPARGRIPVLVSARSIVWLVGQCVAEQAKITPQTQRVLKMEVLLA